MKTLEPRGFLFCFYSLLRSKREVVVQIKKHPGERALTVIFLTVFILTFYVRNVRTHLSTLIGAMLSCLDVGLLCSVKRKNISRPIVCQWWISHDSNVDLGAFRATPLPARPEILIK